MPYVNIKITREGNVTPEQKQVFSVRKNKKPFGC